MGPPTCGVAVVSPMNEFEIEQCYSCKAWDFRDNFNPQFFVGVHSDKAEETRFYCKEHGKIVDPIVKVWTK